MFYSKYVHHNRNHLPCLSEQKHNPQREKSNGQRNYRCKACGRHFIADHERTYRGTISRMEALVRILMVRGAGIRDIAAGLRISTGKVLSTPEESGYRLQPGQKYYDCQVTGEFRAYAGKKSNRIWLIYVYHRATGEIAAYVWGNRDRRTAKKLRERLRKPGITYDRIAADNLESFAGDRHDIGKQYTKGIEGNNCRLRHRVRRAFRKTCCF